MEIYFRPTVDEAKDFARELCETIGGVEYVAQALIIVTVDKPKDIILMTLTKDIKPLQRF